eukprot:11545391-Alexandrium_andersonii.AAC.1
MGRVRALCSGLGLSPHGARGHLLTPLGASLGAPLGRSLPRLGTGPGAVIVGGLLGAWVGCHTA